MSWCLNFKACFNSLATRQPRFPRLYCARRYTVRFAQYTQARLCTSNGRGRPENVQEEKHMRAFQVPISPLQEPTPKCGFRCLHKIHLCPVKS